MDRPPAKTALSWRSGFFFNSLFLFFFSFFFGARMAASSHSEISLYSNDSTLLSCFGSLSVSLSADYGTLECALGVIRSGRAVARSRSRNVARCILRFHVYAVGRFASSSVDDEGNICLRRQWRRYRKATGVPPGIDPVGGPSSRNRGRTSSNSEPCQKWVGRNSTNGDDGQFSPSKATGSTSNAANWIVSSFQTDESQQPIRTAQQKEHSNGGTASHRSKMFIKDKFSKLGNTQRKTLISVHPRKTR